MAAHQFGNGWRQSVAPEAGACANSQRAAQRGPSGDDTFLHLLDILEDLQRQLQNVLPILAKAYRGGGTVEQPRLQSYFERRYALADEGWGDTSARAMLANQRPAPHVRIAVSTATVVDYSRFVSIIFRLLAILNK
jgi:hypothetical protein